MSPSAGASKPPSRCARLIGAPAGPLFFGWRVVVLCCIVNAVGGGVFFQAFTVFFLPLKNDFAVSSAAVSLLYGAARLEGGFDGPLVGYLISRFGPRAVVIAGICMSGGGLFLLTLAQDYWTFFFIYICIVSIGHNAGYFHPLSTLVNYWFVRHRGVGLSLISAAANLGGMILAPVLSAIILNYGWRAGAMTAGTLILLVGLPAAYPIRSTPESLGLHPDGESPAADPPSDQKPTPLIPEPECSVRDALRTRVFWMLAGLISMRLFVTVALNIHLVPILVWGGMGEGAAAYVVSVYALGSVVAILGIGWLGDRWSKPLMSSLGLLPMALAMIGLVFSQATLWLYVLALGLAVAMGTAPLNWALIGDLFGRRSYPTLRGLMGIGYGTMTFLSPIYAGWVYDATGSYSLVLLTFTGVIVIAAALFARLPAFVFPRSGGPPLSVASLPQRKDNSKNTLDNAG